MIVCCGCSGKEIYLSTAKIAPSLRNFLTPYVPVRHGTVRSIVVPRAAARVLFTKLGKLCVFDAVRTRRRAESCRFCRKIPFFLTFFLQKECYNKAARATAASLAWLTPSFCTHIGYCTERTRRKPHQALLVVGAASRRRQTDA